MPLKPVIQALAAIWLVVFAISFVSLRDAESSDDLASSLNRIVAFLTWQIVAFAVAAAGTLTTRQAIARGHRNVRVVGYTPFAISVFVIAAFVILMAVRFLVVPMFESVGLL